LPDVHEIAARHERWEITGGPEIRSQAAAMFSPSSKLAPRAARVPVEDSPALDRLSDVSSVTTLTEIERFLLLVFLRRYVTYCARRRRFAQMNGAARLLRTVRAWSELTFSRYSYDAMC
jgi:hypothetical protein